MGVKLKKVLISVTNDLGNDQRVHRVATTLSRRGYEVLVIGRERAQSGPLPERPYATKRLKPWFDKGKLFYLEFNIRLFFFLLSKPGDILLSNDLDTLLANFFASKLKFARLVYDSHEYFTEVPELINRKFTRAVWLFLERLLFPWIKYAYTVNHSIASIYKKKYGIEIGVIRNLPFRRENPPAPNPSDKILIYQGALNIGRGIELMIDTMEFLPGYTLIIAGRGDVEEALKRRALEQGVDDQIQFLGFIPLEELSAYTSKAALGFSIEEDLGQNYHFALPNKVFDYIQAGVPVIVSNLPEMKRVIDEFQVGKVLYFDKRSPAELAELVKEVVEDPNAWFRFHSKCRKSSLDLCWEAEQNKLLQYYSVKSN